MTLDMNRLIDNAASTGTVTTASNLLGGDRKTIYSLASKLAAERVLLDCNVLELTVKQLNRPPLQAALVLGDLLGLSPENVFEVFPVITPLL